MAAKQAALVALDSHNQALRQLLTDGDRARNAALLKMVEEGAEEGATTASTSPRAASPALRGAVRRGAVFVEQDGIRKLRQPDDELRFALDDLRVVQPLQTPVKWVKCLFVQAVVCSDWAKATAKVWERLHSAFVGVSIPERATQKLIQVAKYASSVLCL